ncbi:MAG: AAA family ATPase [Gammaproteobacteria bacterium]|nr:AAA family ATPase [Gammaproteobacteria bacterium]
MNLRKLYEHLDQDSRRILSNAADAAAREGRRSISLEFFLLSLLRDRGSGAALMSALEQAGADGPAIESALARFVAEEPRSAAGALPSFDESLAHLLREAWALSFDDYGDASVSPVRFFETIARRGDAWPRLAATLPSFDRIDPARLASAVGARASAQVDAAPGATDEQFPELSRYGYDMVARARDGGFDPVVGFESQMQAISSVLLRRRQNSVAVVGEAGVGKSACALGFVQALAEGSDKVAGALHETPVWALDISALRAGAVVRGALEERLQAIMAEISASGMILFMDDLHLLFGDQSQGGDALRSVLSGGGSVRILGTCGWREWRRHVEPDPGLARRIAPVRIQEPDDVQSLAVVEGIAPVLAEHHDVEFADSVLESAVSLARRYIVGRQLPDKAIVVLDSACARARMNGRAGSVLQVEDDDVAAVVSDLTGVPIGSMLSDVSRMAGRLEQVLSERVVGQDDALARCASQARAYLAGLSDRRRPVGALMFCGPSGVGKTETAHAIADALFGGRLLNINMSEYQEAHTVSALKGAPAGYVGYGEGGVLTEGIRRTPYCVVLLDEIEKAHRDVIEMLYQVLDRGWMEDAEGIEADFSNALIILTTNAGDTVVEQVAMADPPPFEDDFHRTLSAALGRQFPAAFIGRLQLVPYWPLGDDTLATIAGMRLDRLADAYAASHRARLSFDDDVSAWLTERVKTTPQGARFLDGVIARSIRPAIAEYVLDRLAAEEAPGDAVVRLRNGEFAVARGVAGLAEQAGESQEDATDTADTAPAPDATGCTGTDAPDHGVD